MTKEEILEQYRYELFHALKETTDFFGALLIIESIFDHKYYSRFRIMKKGNSITLEEFRWLRDRCFDINYKVRESFLPQNMSFQLLYDRFYYEG